MRVHRVGARYTYNVVAPRYYRSVLRRERFDVMVEDLNKVPLFTPLWYRDRFVLLVHHLFGETAFREAGLPLATATWLLERPLHMIYHDVPVEAVSVSTAQDLVRRGLLRENIEVIENGVDLGFFTHDPAVPPFPEPTILYLGGSRNTREWT